MLTTAYDAIRVCGMDIAVVAISAFVIGMVVGAVGFYLLDGDQE